MNVFIIVALLVSIVVLVVVVARRNSLNQQNTVNIPSNTEDLGSSDGSSNSGGSVFLMISLLNWNDPHRRS
jgi:hypothetical protein